MKLYFLRKIFYFLEFFEVEVFKYYLSCFDKIFYEFYEFGFRNVWSGEGIVVCKVCFVDGDLIGVVWFWIGSSYFIFGF